MDPTENLKEQLRLCGRLDLAIDKGYVLDPDDVGRLTELVIALDNWLANGGFLPSRWADGRRQHITHGSPRSCMEDGCRQCFTEYPDDSGAYEFEED